MMDKQAEVFNSVVREYLETLSLTELIELRNRVDARLKWHFDKNRLYPPKYRNPDNYLQTWSGRGRKPYWFRVQVFINGVSPKQMRYY